MMFNQNNDHLCAMQGYKNKQTEGGEREGGREGEREGERDGEAGRGRDRQGGNEGVGGGKLQVCGNMLNRYKTGNLSQHL